MENYLNEMGNQLFLSLFQNFLKHITMLLEDIQFNEVIKLNHLHTFSQ